MKDRLKKLRLELGLSGEKFGENLGVSKMAISKMENGRTNITEQSIKLICSTYNVNEEWLRNGTGEMFVESSDSLIEKIVSEFPLDKLSQTILRTYIELEPKEREVFNHVMKVIANNIMEEGKEKAVNGINDIILNSYAPEHIKRSMYGKAAMVFNEAFPNAGVGQFDISTHGEEELSEKEQYMKLADELFDKEKEQESKSSSAKESDVG